MTSHPPCPTAPPGGDWHQLSCLQRTPRLSRLVLGATARTQQEQSVCVIVCVIVCMCVYVYVCVCACVRVNVSLKGSKVFNTCYWHACTSLNVHVCMRVWMLARHTSTTQVLVPNT